MRLPPELKAFVNETSWTFAKTYAKTWPHEYIVRDRVDEEPFLSLVRHIREHGYEGRFYHKPITYFDEDGKVYWTMGAPIAETTIVNRCTKEQSYKQRLLTGTLPEQSQDTTPNTVGASDLTFTSKRLLVGFEGGAIYTAEAGGKYYVIQDESTLAELLDGDDREGLSFVTHVEFETLSDQDKYIRRQGWKRLPHMKRSEESEQDKSSVRGKPRR